MPTPQRSMLSRSAKRPNVLIRKLQSESSKWTDLVARTTSTTRIMVLRTHPAALQQVASHYPCLVLETNIYCRCIPGTRYWNATNTGWIKILMLESSLKSDGRRTQCLLWLSAWKQRMFTRLFCLPLGPPKWLFRSLRFEALTQTSQ
jgi:hypothetical protein